MGFPSLLLGTIISILNWKKKVGSLSKSFVYNAYTVSRPYKDRFYFWKKGPYRGYNIYKEYPSFLYLISDG